ncbi:MAG: hypothetical protein LBC77_07835, partial [Spirochaetaceae bacterium]|nr:hypothetical protein [Spirochaetaceae bacterium]
MRPGRSLFAAACTAFILGATAWFLPELQTAVLYFALFLTPVIVFDALFLVFFTDRLKVSRLINSSHAFGRVSSVQLTVERTGRGARPLRRVMVFDLYDDLFDCDDFPAKLKPPLAGGRSVLRYNVLAARRGD